MTLEESAKNYVIQHKTIFSLADIIDFAPSGVVEHMEHLVKSRLFPSEYQTVASETKEETTSKSPEIPSILPEEGTLPHLIMLALGD